MAFYLLYVATLAAPPAPPAKQPLTVVSVTRLAPDAAQLAAADRLLDAMHYDSLIDRTIEALVAEAQKTFPQQLEQRLSQPLPKELKDQLFTVIASSMRNSMSANRAEMRRGTALIYASRFSVPELEHLIALQKDPVMAKMQAEMPGIAAESTALGRAAVDRELPRMAERIQQVVKDYFAAHGGSPGT
jgi:hypothetical protein